MGQSQPTGFGPNQIVGFILGMGLVIAVAILVARRGKRAQIARRERPPQGTKILRPAGYSLSSRIDGLQEKWHESSALAIAGGGLLGIVVSTIYPIAEGVILQRFTLAEIWRQLPASTLWSGIALAVALLAWTFGSLVNAFCVSRAIRNCRFGLRGEQAVAEAMADRTVAAAGYVTFHDVPGDGPWNIDHVVVGPGGVFVLETKTRPRRKATRDQPEHEVCFDGQNLQFPWCNDCTAVPQAERNMRWIERFLTGFAPVGIIVNAVVVVPGWFVKTDGDHPIKVMNATYLATYILSLPRRFAPQQLQPIIRALEERCRDLEF